MQPQQLAAERVVPARGGYQTLRPCLPARSACLPKRRPRRILPPLRRRLMTFITASRLKSNRLEAAKELKNMVFFSNIVLAPLVGDLKVSAGSACALPARR